MSRQLGLAGLASSNVYAIVSDFGAVLSSNVNKTQFSSFKPCLRHMLVCVSQSAMLSGQHEHGSNNSPLKVQFCPHTYKHVRLQNVSRSSICSLLEVAHPASQDLSLMTRAPGTACTPLCLSPSSSLHPPPPFSSPGRGLLAPLEGLCPGSPWLPSSLLTNA